MWRGRRAQLGRLRVSSISPTSTNVAVAEEIYFRSGIRPKRRRETLMRTPPIFVLMAVSVPASALTAVPVHAQDIDGAKDHPMFSRMPGYVITNYDTQDFGAHEFRTYPETRVEGHYWNISYEVKEGATKAGPLQIGRNYTGLIVKRGGQRLMEELDSGGGYTVARLPLSDGRSLWLELSVSNSGEMYDLTVIEEAGLKQEVECSATELANALNANGSRA
jgi:OmpA-OmpF porin, OOP family